MKLIDNRGRLFGRWNLIDALAASLVLLVIPLGYGAYLLFRVPVPTITSIEPAQVQVDQEVTLRIKGENLRPFLRARFGTEDFGYLVESPTAAEIKLPLPRALPPGVYDLLLFDEQREVLRKPAALTVTTPRTPLPVLGPRPLQIEMQAVGAFVDLTEGDLPVIRAGAVFDTPKPPRPANAPAPKPGEEELQEKEMQSAATVLTTLPPEEAIQRAQVTATDAVTTPIAGKLQVPAVVRLRCGMYAAYCLFGELNVALTQTLAFAIPRSPEEKFTRPLRYVYFRIDDLRPVNSPVTYPYQVVGTFVGLTSADAPLITAGMRFGRDLPFDGVDDDVGEVLAVRPPTADIQIPPATKAILSPPTPDNIQMPAVLRLKCVVSDKGCKVGGVAVKPRAMITLPLAGTSSSARDQVKFLVQEVRPANAARTFPSARTGEATVRVQFLVRPEVIDLIKPGDIDQSTAPPGGDPAAENSGRAVLVSLDSQPQPMTGRLRTGSGLEFDQKVLGLEATVRVPAALSAAGWQYKGRPLKAGAAFNFEGLLYTVEGWVMDVRFAPESRIDTQ